MRFHERIPLDSRHEREVDTEVLIKKAYEKALSSVHEAEINPTLFRDLYGKEAVEADIAYVEEMERTFTQEGEQGQAQKLGTIFEAILHDRVAYSHWLGKETSSQKTSRYDDIKNGIDEVVETEVHGVASSYLGLALDATLSATDEKFRRIKREINEGKLGTVKYFRSKKGEFRGELSQVPRVVVTADAKTVLELATLWLEKRHKELHDHPFQHQMLEEIEVQLDQFEHYARATGNRGEVADTFARSRTLISSIRKTKEETLPDKKIRDGGMSKIRSHLSLLTTE